MEIQLVYTTSSQIDNLPIANGQVCVLTDKTAFYYDMGDARHALIDKSVPELGFGYALCSTPSGTAAKVASIADYELGVGGLVAIRFSDAVDASSTLNINNKGATPIYFRGSAITADVIGSDTTALMMYDGTNYNVVGLDSASALEDLTDVNINNPTDGQVLKYDATSGEWINGQGGGTGDVADVEVNGQSVVNPATKIAEITSYKEVTQAEYDALPSSKESDGIAYFIKDATGGVSSWTDIEGVLTAGSTTLTLSSTSIKTTSVLNIYVDTFGICPIDVEVSNGSVTLTFNELENDLSVLVRITENGAEPSPYTLMNYLEVTSQGAYIDTGVTNSATAYFEIDFQYTGTPIDNNDGVFGAMGSGNEFVVNSYNGVSYATVGGLSRAVFTATNLDRHVIKADNSGILIDEVSSGASVDWSRATGYNYFLFAFNYLNNQKYYTGHAKIYSVKLWDGDTLVREFIPAIRNADSEIGMYDRVNDVFYTNDGTGTFTVG